MKSQTDELLTAESVGEFLAARGLIPANEEVSARELGGGISNVVLAVDAGSSRLVVKQSLPKLRVADDWPAKRERITTEAEALRLGGRIYPDSVPAVVASYRDAYVLVIQRAPDEWKNFKEVLLVSEPLPWVAQRCGAILGAWHSHTWEDPDVERRFNDREAFDQLRVDPYHRTTARRRPEIADAIGSYVDRMLENRRCLVHGDFSPKNVLFGNGGLWVVDFEVAHFGDPVFDLAFMINHLLLKSIHRPEIAEGCRRSAESFLAEYAKSAESPGFSYLLGHTACLMLARVDGKSPAEYLTDQGRARARELGDQMLVDPPRSLSEAWKLL